MDGIMDLVIGDATNRRVVSYRSVPGFVICLGCNNKFHSPDKLHIRICNRCKSGRERVGLVGESAVIVHGIEIVERDVFTDES